MLQYITVQCYSAVLQCDGGRKAESSPAVLRGLFPVNSRLCPRRAGNVAGPLLDHYPPHKLSKEEKKSVF